MVAKLRFTWRKNPIIFLDISREKTIEGAAHFDKSALKHVEIHESHNVEGITLLTICS